MPDPDPMAIFALHRYFLWADQMREHYYRLLGSRKDSEQDTALEVSFRAPYMSYWYGGTYVVIEGWKELGLADPEIDALLASPHVDALRLYRNGSFHFQAEYFHQKFTAFVGTEGTPESIFALRQAFSRWFLDFFRTHTPPQG